VETHFFECFGVNLTEEAFQVLYQAWRPATRITYFCAWQEWIRWLVAFRSATSLAVDSRNPSPEIFVNFLSFLFHGRNLKASTVLAKKSGVLLFFTSSASLLIEKSTALKFFLQGISKCQPRVEHAGVWEVEPVLLFLETFVFPRHSLYFLGRHLALLILLLGGRRIHDLTLLDIRAQYLVFSGDTVMLQPLFGSKTDKSNCIQSPFTFVSGPAEQLSVPVMLRLYLQLSAPWRGPTTRLFVSPQQPSSPASIHKLRSWVKSYLNEAGAGDVTPGSTRAAVATQGVLQGLTVEQIMARGNWASADVVFRHYLRARTIDPPGVVLQRWPCLFVDK
jgi:hypothetical protein